MKAIKKTDNFLMLSGEDKMGWTKVVRITDNKVTCKNIGYAAHMEIQRAKEMSDSKFEAYCRGLIYS